jgi:hypothetical protein
MVQVSWSFQGPFLDWAQIAIFLSSLFVFILSAKAYSPQENAQSNILSKVGIFELLGLSARIGMAFTYRHQSHNDDVRLWFSWSHFDEDKWHIFKWVVFVVLLLYPFLFFIKQNLLHAVYRALLQRTFYSFNSKKRCGGDGVWDNLWGFLSWNSASEPYFPMGSRQSKNDIYISAMCVNFWQRDSTDPKFDVLYVESKKGDYHRIGHHEVKVPAGRWSDLEVSSIIPSLFFSVDSFFCGSCSLVRRWPFLEQQFLKAVVSLVTKSEAFPFCKIAAVLV